MSYITINNLTVAYNHQPIIENISFEIEKGEFVCIIGPNGAGKTTLLKTILGLVNYKSGCISFEDNKKPIISYMPQVNDIDRNFPISVKETILSAMLKKGLHPFKKYTKPEILKAEELLQSVGLSDFGDRQIGELSGGQFKRMLIARALAVEPQILILDEPTSDSDAISRNAIFSLLKDLNQKGMTIITSTHDLEATQEYTTKLISINKSLVYCGEVPKDNNIYSYLYGEKL